MSNGDSLDGFVFPPFIPAAAARPASPPAPAPQPPAASDEPAPDAQSAGPGRMTMPWDVETPIVSEPADTHRQAAAPQPAAGEAEDEDLPWLERPAPREAVSEAPAEAPAAPAQDEAFPDWLAWDDRATDDARSEIDAVAPLEGLEDFAPMDEIGGFIAPAPAVEWEEAAPAADAASDIVESSDWSLDAPEAAEPPVLAEPAAELTFDAPSAAAEPAFDVTVEDGAFTFAAAGPAAAVEEPAAAIADLQFAAGDDEPVAAIAEPEVLDTDWQAADAEPDAVSADAYPFVADTEAVLSAEPDPFTAAAVSEAEAPAPADEALTAAAAVGTATNGVFADVASRLEEIARTLRDRPDDLLSGATSDPLALLVAGYVMGYNARR
jgi:hypothetical protein